MILLIRCTVVQVPHSFAFALAGEHGVIHEKSSSLSSHLDTSQCGCAQFVLLTAFRTDCYPHVLCLERVVYVLMKRQMRIAVGCCQFISSREIKKRGSIMPSALGSA